VLHVADVHQSRLKRALRDTPGWHQDTRRRVLQSLIGAACAVGLLVLVGSPGAASDEALAYVGVIVGGAILVNALEFGWHYLKVPYEVLRDEVEALRTEVQALRGEVESSPSEPSAASARASRGELNAVVHSLSPTGVVLLCVERGQSLLDRQAISIASAQKWAEETAELLSSQVGHSQAEGFLGTRVPGTRPTVEARVEYLANLVA
jgi:hypothetical protein